MEYNLNILLSIITSFTIAFLFIPAIIHIAHKKELYDQPDEDRKLHAENISALGGIGVFIGTIFSFLIWGKVFNNPEILYILVSLIIIFIIGIIDDISPIPAWKKLFGQLLAAFILVVYGDVNIKSMFGFAGINQLPAVAMSFISIFTIIVITNAVNLIDGINCLAGYVGVIAASFFGIWFILDNNISMSVLSLSLIGSLIAFLKYNYRPARIFMGDTGSMIVGMILAILAIKFLNCNVSASPNTTYFLKAAPAIAISALIVPLFDTIRVFTIRIKGGGSPFAPDRNHIHHIVLDLGFNHETTAAILASFNIVFILMAIFLSNYLNTFIILGLIIALCLALTQFALVRVKKRKHKLAQ